jgi:hypothetical protein
MFLGFKAWTMAYLNSYGAKANAQQQIQVDCLYPGCSLSFTHSCPTLEVLINQMNV